jgi:hypothetical protein
MGRSHSFVRLRRALAALAVAVAHDTVTDGAARLMPAFITRVAAGAAR